MRRGGLGHTGGAVVAALAMVAALGACGGGDDSSDGRLVFWSIFATADRIAQQEPLLERFTEQTGIEVELVGVAQDQQSQAMISAAASGDLPDVVFHAADRTPGWAEEGILDSDAAEAVVEALGQETFNPGALQFATVNGRLAAVPSDGWGQLLLYRTDLFEQAGLAPPDTFEAITTAARTLHGDGMIGIVSGTRTANNYTMQILEAVMLANGCQLTDSEGRIALTDDACVNALDWYADLMRNYSAGGEQDTETTRASYLSGTAAMIFWSPHLLDELAGVDLRFPPGCPQCQSDPAFLARNTGIVSLISGPDSDQPVQFAQTLNLGITTRADTEAAIELVTWLLSDGYLDFLSMAPEGRFPMRTGTPEAPQAYIDGWAELPIGTADSGAAPVSQLYGPQAVEAIAAGAGGFARWGLGTDDAGLVAALYGELPLTRDLRNALDGAPADEVAASMAAHAEALR